MGKLSGTESISTRSSGDFTTTKSISQFPVTKKKDRKLTRESTDTTLSRRSSLPPVESPGRTYIRGSDTSTTEYRLHSQELYMGRNSFPRAYLPALGPWQVPTGSQMRNIMSRVTRPTEASESRARDCAMQRYSIISARSSDMAADVGFRQQQQQQQQQLPQQFRRAKTK
ncbi:hypothetical protein NP493_172g02050 [Ridgeia piscesae]|uniref:Uncharacterized protein n=1 Tax=Ridgeia piscesae TaxID=27915 RepID=A0AAD9P329_RIDPI|nr:hypothetical protein NP493_172g02050 [Ridgeia piscesae]